MGSKPQCGNCRHYIPSPLERMGWCCHPKLGGRSHLVSGRKLECDHHFPVWWEPREDEAGMSQRSVLTRSSEGRE